MGVQFSFRKHSMPTEGWLSNPANSLDDRQWWNVTARCALAVGLLNELKKGEGASASVANQ